jgi:hypothetical protein
MRSLGWGRQGPDFRGRLPIPLRIFPKFPFYKEKEQNLYQKAGACFQEHAHAFSKLRIITQAGYLFGKNHLTLSVE